MIRSTIASLSSAGSVDGKCSITSGSALSAANGLAVGVGPRRAGPAVPCAARRVAPALVLPGPPANLPGRKSGTAPAPLPGPFVRITVHIGSASAVGLVPRRRPHSRRQRLHGLEGFVEIPGPAQRSLELPGARLGEAARGDEHDLPGRDADRLAHGRGHQPAHRLGVASPSTRRRRRSPRGRGGPRRRRR